MEKQSTDLIKKLKDAQSPEEVSELLKADGQDTAPAERLWKELEALREKSGRELSMDELESVAGGHWLWGGECRDWLKVGCCATVEPGSYCGSNDSCNYWDVRYDHEPIGYCKKCGGIYYIKDAGNDNRYVCVNCGMNGKF